MRLFDNTQRDKKQQLEVLYQDLIQLFDKQELAVESYLEQVKPIINQLKEFGHKAMHEGLDKLLHQDKEVEDEIHLNKLMPFIDELKVLGMPEFRRNAAYEETESTLVAVITNPSFSEDYALRLFKLLHQECRASVWSKNKPGTLLMLCFYHFNREQVAQYIIEQASGEQGLAFLEHANSRDITVLDIITYKLEGKDQGKNFNAIPSIKSVSYNLELQLRNKIRELKRELTQPIEEVKPQPDTTLRPRKKGSTPGSSTDIKTPAITKQEKTANYPLADIISQFTDWWYSPPKTTIKDGNVYTVLSDKESDSKESPTNQMN